MRVLLPTLDTPATLMGGVEWYVVHLAHALEDLGHETRIVARAPADPAGAPEEMRELDVDWVRLPTTGAPTTHRYRLLLGPAFHSAVRRRAPWADIVHGQNMDGLGAAGVRPSVATVHTTPLDEWPSARLGGWRERLYQRPIHKARIAVWRRTLQDMGHVWAVGEHVAASLQALGRDQAEVVPNPVPRPNPLPRAQARTILDIPPDAPVLVYLGRLSPVKRVDRLLRALPALPPDAQVLVAGDGEERGRLERLARDLDTEDQVRFLGIVGGERKRALLSAADVLVLPSEHEGQPLTLLEAISYGLPVVATRASWVPEALRDKGVWGEDDLPGLIDKALSRGRGKGGDVTTWPELAKRFSETYDHVIGPA